MLTISSAPFLGVRRFVGLVVTQANRRLCQVAAERLTEVCQHQAQAQPESAGLREILDQGFYHGEAHRALQAYLAWVNRRRSAVPWLSRLVLRIEIADKLATQTVPPAQWRKLLSAPT